MDQARFHLQIGVEAGLARAVKTPTEIIWLRDEILAELWRRNRLLDDSPGRCADTRNAKQGCTVGNPPSWRYVFGAGSLDPRFKPLTSGVYLISPRANRTGLLRAPSGEILLAAGTSVTLIDAAYPGIQIELTAPPDQPLPLGNLAAADAGKVFALLARQPGVVSASAASMLDSGRVALKSADEMQVAMLAPPSRVVEKAQATASSPPLAFRGTIDVSRFPSGETTKLIAEAEAKLAREIIASAQAYREPRPLDIPRIRTLVFAGTVDIRAAAMRDEKLRLDPGPVVVAAAPNPVVAEAPASPAPIAALPEPAPVTPSAPVQLASAAPDSVPKSEPVRELQRVAGANADIARLRAEVEAEIERDRVRIANLQQQACSSAGRPMQGCTVSSPRRFSFAG